MRHVSREHQRTPAAAAKTPVALQTAGCSLASALHGSICHRLELSPTLRGRW